MVELEVLAEANTGISDVSRVILHATNLRILSDLLSRVTEGSVRVVLVCESQSAKSPSRGKERTNGGVPLPVS